MKLKQEEDPGFYPKLPFYCIDRIGMGNVWLGKKKSTAK